MEIEATVESPAVTANAAVLRVQALSSGDEDTFSADRTWSGFSNHSQFKQEIEGFRCAVGVSFNIIKAWGGYWIDLSSAGISGTAGGCPWAGYRWGRAIGANPMAPDQYYDGANWVALPAGFTLTGTNHSAVGFYKSGANFVATSGGPWPGAFADYDFDSAHYRGKRNAWIRDTHDRWTDKFHIRRKNCRSETRNRCCRYEIEINLAFRTVASHSAGVIAVCPGRLRSNAGVWFMDDTRVEVAAHESGHHMDNPDEYAGGAVDTSLNGDGAASGIDDDSIMGSRLTRVKKRHYHAFVEMTRRLIRAKYGRDYEYEAVDR